MPLSQSQVIDYLTPYPELRNLTDAEPELLTTLSNPLLLTLFVVAFGDAGSPTWPRGLGSQPQFYAINHVFERTSRDGTSSKWLGTTPRLQDIR
jgi:hypothetical protein